MSINGYYVSSEEADESDNCAINGLPHIQCNNVQ